MEPIYRSTASDKSNAMESLLKGGIWSLAFLGAWVLCSAVLGVAFNLICDACAEAQDFPLFFVFGGLIVAGLLSLCVRRWILKPTLSAETVQQLPAAKPRGKKRR